MATLTIDLPDDLMERVKESAAKHLRSVEEELRQTLMERFLTTEELIREARARWARMTPSSAEEVDAWIEEGRP